MNELPIDFNDEMIRALAEGRKTQTRRLVDPQPWPVTKDSFMMLASVKGDWCWSTGSPTSTIVSCKPTGPTDYAKDYSPYGQIGDRLWVREAHDAYMVGTEAPIEDEDNKRFFTRIHYRATDDRVEVDITEDLYTKLDATESKGWTQPKRAQRWASRYLLEITNVRLQRIQDICEEDALAEGAGTAMFGTEVPGRAGPLRSPLCYKAGFACIWDKIYRKKDLGWYVNPWVWAYSFKMV